MMDVINAIVSGIQTLGFPIAVACLSFWYIKYRDDKNDNKISDLLSSYEAERKETRDLHRQETKELTDAITNNTMVIQKLLDKLDDDVK